MKKKFEELLLSFNALDSETQTIYMVAISLGILALIYIYYRYKFVNLSKSISNKKAKEVTAVEVTSDRKSLSDALTNTKSNFSGRIKSIFSGETLTENEIEDLEEILYTSDLGPNTVQKLTEAAREALSNQSEKLNFASLTQALKDEMLKIFNVNTQKLVFEKANGNPVVWMIVGVNGAGKTTTIGKLASKATNQGLKVMVAAGDTFRAAAGDQLEVWSKRAGVEIYSKQDLKDPSALAYEACEKAKAEEFDLVIVDTAGRLHTQDHLMEELKKMKRVISKVIPEGPKEVLIVLDSNSGQNALIQTEKFNSAIDLTGAILTKLDGTAKGGVAVGVAYEHGLAIKSIGVGEGIEDLREFNPQEFVDSIL